MEKTPAIQNAAELTEQQRRMLRAQRFGIDTSTIMGPQVQDTGYERMDISAKGQMTEKRLDDNIAKIKARQERFAEQELPNVDERIENLENRKTKLHNQAKPEEIKSEAVIIEDCLYLYGTDYMSTREIKEHFMRYPTMHVQWINDSSCTLKFQTEQEASEAYRQFSVKPVDKDESLNFDERNFDERIGWREALGYKHDVKGWQTLWIRFSTDLDVKKPDTKGTDSKFYKFMQSNKKHYKGAGLLKKGISKGKKYDRTAKDVLMDIEEKREADEQQGGEKEEAAEQKTEQQQQQDKDMAELDKELEQQDAQVQEQ